MYTLSYASFGNKQTNKRYFSQLCTCVPGSAIFNWVAEKKKKENCTEENLPYGHQVRKCSQALENVGQLWHLDSSSYRERLCKKSELYHMSLLTPWKSLVFTARIKHTNCSINIQCPGRAYVPLLHFSQGGRGLTLLRLALCNGTWQQSMGSPGTVMFGW